MKLPRWNFYQAPWGAWFGKEYETQSHFASEWRLVLRSVLLDLNSVTPRWQWERIHLPMQETQVDPWIGKIPWRGNGNPFQYSCLENPGDRGAWQAIVHGVAKSRTWLSNWTRTVIFPPCVTWNRSEDRHFTQVGLTVVTNIDTWVQTQLSEARTSGDDMQILLYF